VDFVALWKNVNSTETDFSISVQVIEKFVVAKLVKKFTAFYGNRRFIIVFKMPFTAPYPQSVASSLYLPTLFP
jgi:hypothetical protein